MFLVTSNVRESAATPLIFNSVIHPLNPGKEGVRSVSELSSMDTLSLSSGVCSVRIEEHYNYDRKIFIEIILCNS